MRDRVEQLTAQQTAVCLDCSADFADDGVDGGDYEEVLKVVERELAIGAEYGIRNNYTKMVLYPLAGQRFTGEVARFAELGIKIDYSGNVKFMQVPIAGSAAFIREWIDTKMGIIWRVLEGVRGLSNKHAALYLLRRAGHGCRVLYYLRTTPREMFGEFVEEFDQELRTTLEAVAGLSLNNAQWERAGMRVKQSGLGLCRAGDIADVAYLSSRAGAFEDCVGLDRRHEWDDGPARDNGSGDGLDDVLGEWLLGCITQANLVLPQHAR